MVSTGGFMSVVLGPLQSSPHLGDLACPFTPPLFLSSTGVGSFAWKGQLINILGFADHMVPVAILQLCPCHTKVSTGDTPVNECGCLPIIFNMDTEM